MVQPLDRANALFVDEDFDGALLAQYNAAVAAENGWVVGLEGRSTLSLCSERALNLAPAPSRAQT